MANWRFLTLAALTAALALSPLSAQTAEDSILCGTSEETSNPLAKTADLPKVSKVYSGKSIAIMLRIAFSNAAYTVTDSAIDKTHATINGRYRSMSRNIFEFDFKIHPEIWTAPGTVESYGSNFASLESFISTKLKEAGYVRGTNYTVFVANFPRIGVRWAGLSYGPGGGGNYISGSYSSGVIAHELGHVLGLPHAHSIEAGSEVFGTPGTTSQHVEYGNPYDVMGYSGPLGHFNINAKWRIGWLDKDEVLEVKNTGVYRLYAQDNALHKGKLLGIRVPSGNASYAYWFEYRATSTYARIGAAVLFEGFQGSNSKGIHLLDLTPQSRASSDAQDAVLETGKSFQDKYGAATFKTLATNTGVWNENGWVDLEVTLPGTVPVAIARPGNPTLAASATGKGYNLLGQSIKAAQSPQRLVHHLGLSAEPDRNHLAP